MKKLFLSFIFACLALTVVACDKTTTLAPTTLAPTTVAPTTEVPTTEAPTTLEPIDNTFINTNSSIETKEQFLDKMDMYIAKMDELIDDAVIPEYVDFTQQSPYIKALAVEEPDIYNREDLPVPEEPLFDEDQLNLEFIYITYQLLITANDVLESCTSFTENEFCDIEMEGVKFKIKTLLEDNQLYIEYYTYYYMELFGITIKQVSGQIMYFNLIDDVLYFESIQDDLIYYDEEFTHILRYNQFNELGDMVNIMIDDIYREHVYYQSYFRAEDSVFLLSNSGEGFAINYKNIANDTFYSLTLNPDLTTFNTSVIYGTHNPTFKYLSFDDATMIVWNMFDVTGWNKVYDYGYGNDMLYLDDNQVLEGFYFDFEMQEEDIDHQLSFQIIEPEDLTEGLISLSDYGMVYSQVTYAQLMADIEFIQENYPTVITNNGLSNTMEDNYDILQAMFPASLDQELMEELFAIIEQQIEEN